MINVNNLANNKGLLIVLSGPSGAGKGTVLKNVLERYPNLKVSVSVTTRNMREGEVDGISYFFRSVEEFKELVHNESFLEYEDVYGNYYGTLKSYVDDLRDKGIDVLLEIDTKGAINVKNKAPDAVMIFLIPRDKQTIKDRLIGRGSESAESLAKRIAAAEGEIAKIGSYDYVVINDDVNRCASDIMTIINAEKCSVKKCAKFIDNYR